MKQALLLILLACGGLGCANPVDTADIDLSPDEELDLGEVSEALRRAHDPDTVNIYHDFPVDRTETRLVCELDTSSPDNDLRCWCIDETGDTVDCPPNPEEGLCDDAAYLQMLGFGSARATGPSHPHSAALAQAYNAAENGGEDLCASLCPGMTYLYLGSIAYSSCSDDINWTTGETEHFAQAYAYVTGVCAPPE